MARVREKKKRFGSILLDLCRNLNKAVELPGSYLNRVTLVNQKKKPADKIMSRFPQTQQIITRTSSQMIMKFWI